MDFVVTARRAALAAGIIGLMAAGIAVAGELTMGEDFMGSPAAGIGGWLAYASPVLMALALAGVAVRWSGHLGRGGVAALAVLVVSTAASIGAAATLALMVPTLVDLAPHLATSPPPAVPASFIASGLAMAVGGIALAVALRPHLESRVFAFLVAGAVVAMLPLPSRSFLLALALAAVISGRAASRPARP